MHAIIPKSINTRWRLSIAGDQVNWVILSLLLLFGPIANTPAMRHALLFIIIFICLYKLIKKEIVAQQLSFYVPWFCIVMLSALWSPKPITTLTDATWEVCGPIASGILAMHLASRTNGKILFLPFAALLIGELVSVLGGLHVHADLDMNIPTWIIQTYQGRGVASTIGALLIPIGIWTIYMHSTLDSVLSRRVWLITGILLLGTGLLLGILGHNRMFWYATFIGSLIWIAKLWNDKRRVCIVFATLLISIYAAGTLYSSWIAKGNAPNEIKNAIPTIEKSYTSDARWKLWKLWIGVISDQPILGYGYGTRILPRIGENKISADITDYAIHDHAHNVVLNVLVQTGFIGLICFLWMLLGISRQLYNISRRPYENLRKQAAGIGAASILLTALAKSMTDDFFWGPANIIMWVFIGLFVGHFIHVQNHHNKLCSTTNKQ